MIVEISEKAIRSPNETLWDLLDYFAEYSLLPFMFGFYFFILFFLSIRHNYKLTTRAPFVLNYFSPLHVKSGKGKLRCLLLVFQALIMFVLLSGNIFQKQGPNETLLIRAKEVSTTELDTQCLSWTILVKQNSINVDCLDASHQWSKYTILKDYEPYDGLLGLTMGLCDNKKCLKATVKNVQFIQKVKSKGYLFNYIDSIIDMATSRINNK